MKHYYPVVVLALLIASAGHAQKQEVLHSGTQPETLARTNSLPEWAQGDMRGGGIANDECAGAITLTVGAVCTPLASSYAGATESMEAVTCGIYTASVANDVWFSFVATSDGTTIEVNGAPFTDPIIQVFTGPCGNLANLACADATFIGGTETALIATTAGQTYYFRTYYWPYLTPPENFNFSVCVYGTPPPPPPPPPPANDACVDAIMLAPGVTCTFTPGSWFAATQSMEPETCNEYTASVAHDTWFGFTASTSITTVYVQGVTGNDPVVQLFSGTCGNLTSLDCRDHTFDGGMETLEYNTTPGMTYYFRTYYWYVATAPTTYEYSTCVVEGAGTMGMMQNNMNDWRIFPNPNKGSFTLENSRVEGAVELRLIDLGGRTVHSSTLATGTGGRHQIDLGTNMAPGSYFLHMTGDGLSHVERLVIE